MPFDTPLCLAIAGVVVSAMALAAGLDQSIKQLPARRRIEAVAYSAYSLAADAHNGLFWYVPMAILRVSTTIAAAVAGWADHPSGQRASAWLPAAVGLPAAS